MEIDEGAGEVRGRLGNEEHAAAQTVTNVARVQTLTNAAERKLMDQNVGLPEEWSPPEEEVWCVSCSDRQEKQQCV